jgi:hypothetical protein
VVVAGVGFGIAFIFGQFRIALTVAVVAIVAAFFVGVPLTVFAWLFDQEIVPLDLASAESPPAALAADRRTGTAAGVTIGVAVGAAFGGLSGYGGAGAIGAALIGIAALAVAAVICSSVVAAWPLYAAIQAWHALRHELPWQLMSFLADAHRKGVLRQAGAVYQFRHVELQHRLANRDTDERQANSAAPPATAQ